MGTHRLTLLRHGQAEPMDAYPEDFERPLTRRGLGQVREMARRLVHRSLQPELILVSPAERAWATAEIIAAACDLESRQLLGARELYLAGAETIWHLLTEQRASLTHILICGHNPGLSELASRFGPTPQKRELGTAGMAFAIWHDAEWASLLPEAASAYEADDPDDLTDF